MIPNIRSMALVPAISFLSMFSAAQACELSDVRPYFTQSISQACPRENGAKEVFVEKTESRLPGNANLVSRGFSMTCNNGTVYIGTLLSDATQCQVVSASYRLSEKI